MYRRYCRERPGFYLNVFLVINRVIQENCYKYAVIGRFTVKPHMLVAIMFGGFENNTIWQIVNLAILLKES